MVGFKSIGHNKYTGRMRNFRSKTIPIHRPVNKSELKFSYSIIHFIWLPQSVSKTLINSLSQKFSYASMIIDPVINGFSHNEVRFNLYICDHSIITFGKILSCLGFLNTYHVDSIDGN